MKQFESRTDDFQETRIVEREDRPDLLPGQFIAKIDQFAFTANNITYAVFGERMSYWQFFPSIGNDTEQWGVIPVWGFADVVRSNSPEVAVGERLYGYFPPASETVLTVGKVTDSAVIEGSAHRAELPPAYNRYQRVLNEPSYDRAGDPYRALLAPLFITSFSLWDSMNEANFSGAKQIVILSASSKTSIGLAYALSKDESAPQVIGVTSPGNRDTTANLNFYD
ncbi:MAG: DUF2855 family protein, partial [Pseudomonadota bacterium]